MRFLGIAPIFMEDVVGMICFTLAALCFGVPWWVSPFIGIAAWRMIAQ